MMYNKLHRDAIGRQIKVGDVIVHCTKHSSTLGWNTGVVRELRNDGSISWEWPSEQTSYNWETRETNRWTVKKTTIIYRTDHCVIVDLPEAEVFC